MVGLSLLGGQAQADSMYNAVKSNVAIYNNRNFDKQVANNREKGISVVQFYNGSGKQAPFKSICLSWSLLTSRLCSDLWLTVCFVM